MARTLNMLLFIVFVVVSMLHVTFTQSTTSSVLPPSRVPVTHIVDGNIEWTVPPSGLDAYQTWARGQSFVVGDVLVFNFLSGAHDVAEVSRSEHDMCNTNIDTSSRTEGPARITLTFAGEHRFMCTIPSHCSLGQRLAINVTDVQGSTAMPPSSTTPPPLPHSVLPPTNNSAPFAKALTFTLLAVALAFLYN